MERDYLGKIDREDIYQPLHSVKLKDTTVFVKSFPYGSGKLLAIYNPQLELAKRMHAIEKPEKYNPGKARYLGFSLIYHTTEMTNGAVVKSYFEKDIVEKAYRELKSTINLNPIRKYRIDPIRAHVKICYLSYAILSYIQYKVKPMGISATYAIAQLQSVYKVTLESKADKLKWDKIVTLKNEQKKIMKLLECSV